MSVERIISVEPSVDIPGNIKESVFITVRNILRLYDNSVENEDVSTIILRLKKPSTKRSYEKDYKIFELRFPGACPRKLQQFLMIIKVLRGVYDNLSNNRIITKRDLYYQDVELFQKQQRNADNMVAMVAFSLGVDISNIGIVAAQKGLVFGDLNLNSKEHETIKITRANGVTLIPPISGSTMIVLQPKVKYVLVIEKEAVFKQLTEDLNDGSFLLVTGKGYPDHLTHQFVCKLSSQHNDKVKILGLADSDPHGINILMQYYLGNISTSKSIRELPMEKSPSTCRSLEYFGVSLCDYTLGWLPLSNRDFKFAKALIKRLTEAQDSLQMAKELGLNCDKNLIIIQQLKLYKRELQRQMIFLKKCEMNVVGTNKQEKSAYKFHSEQVTKSSRLASYVLNKLSSNSLQSKKSVH